MDEVDTSEIMVNCPRSHDVRSQTTVTLRINKGEGKAIPLQAWTGSEGSRRLRLPDFKIIGT